MSSKYSYLIYLFHNSSRFVVCVIKIGEITWSYIYNSKIQTLHSQVQIELHASDKCGLIGLQCLTKHSASPKFCKLFANDNVVGLRGLFALR